MSDLDLLFQDVDKLVNENKAYEAARLMQDYGNKENLTAVDLGLLYVAWLEAKAAN